MSNRMVSIIMPSYNTGHLMSGSIESILAQTYKEWELLIIDDHSEDESTLSILKHYEQIDPRIKVIYLTDNRGAGYARNKGMQMAKGRYIAFCDSDDRWFPEKLEKQLAFIQEKKCCLVYSSYIYCNQEGMNRGVFIAPRLVTYGGIKRDDKIGFLTALYDTETHGKHYFPLLRKRQDWGMLILMLKKCRKAYGMKEPLAYYRIRTDSLSSNKLSLVGYTINVYHKVLGYSYFKSYMYFTFLFLPTYACKVIKKMVDSRIYHSVWDQKVLE